MSLRFHCDCGRALEVSEALAGQRVRCPACQKVVVAVPMARIKEEEIPMAAAVGGGGGGEPVPVRYAVPPVGEWKRPASGGRWRWALASAAFSFVAFISIAVHGEPVMWGLAGLAGFAFAVFAFGRLRRRHAGFLPRALVICAGMASLAQGVASLGSVHHGSRCIRSGAVPVISSAHRVEFPRLPGPRVFVRRVKEPGCTCPVHGCGERVEEREAEAVEEPR